MEKQERKLDNNSQGRQTTATRLMNRTSSSEDLAQQSLQIMAPQRRGKAGCMTLRPS